MAKRDLMRVRGGVECEVRTGRWYAVICVWNNPAGVGPCDKYTDPESFATHDEAYAHYETVVRPKLLGALDALVADPGLDFSFRRDPGIDNPN